MTADPRPLFPPHVAAIRPYRPGMPREDVEREPGAPEPVKLASNENALGPSPRALAAIRDALPGLHFYPQGDGRRLREAIAERLWFDPAWVLLGNGSTEIIEIAARTFLDRDQNAVVSAQAFLMYRIAVQAVNGNVREVPLRDRTHDLDAMARAVDARTKLLFVANPNNPTGTAVGEEALGRFLAAVPDDVVVVVDEAYREYLEGTDVPDALEPLRRGRRNLLVLRTFSKAHGLAGLRIGYALGHPALHDGLHRVRSPFNTSSLAQAGALAALADDDHVERSRRTNALERSFLFEALRSRGVDVTPSVANFLLVDTGEPCDELFARLLRRGVIVRPMAAYGFPTAVRVSVGTREQNERFLAALES